MITFSFFLNEIRMPKERHQVKKNAANLPSWQSDGYEKVRDLDIVKYMKQYGLTKLGSGYYAYVFSHPSKNYVVKVFADDPNTVKWYSWVKRNQHNKYVPKLRGSPVKVVKDVYAVRLEKLHPVSRLQYNNFFNTLYDDDVTDRDLLQLRTILYSLSAFDDLHEDNIMVRPNGEIVVTDPIASFMHAKTKLFKS